MNTQLIGIKYSSTMRQKKKTKIYFEAPITIESNANFQCNPKIGAFTYFVSGRIRGLKVIGRYCSIANDVKIGEPNHPIDWLSTSGFQYNPARFGWYDKDLEKIAKPFVATNKKQTKPLVIIGHDVWVGAGAQILRGVEVGHGAIIAAGAVVTRNVMPYEIVGGVPAQRIKFRFPIATIQRLLQVAWWQYHPSNLEDIDFTDIDSALAELERRQAKDVISPWNGDWFQLSEGNVTALEDA